jgi:hypothetical protein
MKIKRIITLTALGVFLSISSFSQIAIGTITPHASAELHLNSTTKGFLVPRITNAQKNLIANPATGLQVWCTDCGTSGELQVFNGSTWTNIIGGTANCAVPNAPTSPVATAGNTKATVSFTAPVPNGGCAITSYTVTSSPGGETGYGSSPIVVYGLTNGTSYTFTVTATNATGTSAASVSSNTVTPYFTCGTDPVTFYYNGQPVTYLTVQRAYGGTVGTKCWLDRNLGASNPASNSTDASSYGHLFQWGRGADGHQIPTSNTTSGTSASTTPGIYFLTGTGNWYTGSDGSLWQGASGTNNPCPSGFRLPTVGEFNAERQSWSSQNPAGAFGSPLKFPMAGSRANSGFFDQTNTYGRYWTSLSLGSSSAMIQFSEAVGAEQSISSKVDGHSVRCIKE